MADKPSVGFVGVGNMGWPMAACLVKAGFTVHVNDSRREVANNFVQQVGGDAPDTLRQLGAASDVVITMLPTSVIVEHVLGGGDDNVFAGMKPGTIVIEMSSGLPSVTQHLAEQVTLISPNNDAITIQCDAQTHLPLKRSFEWRDPVYKDKITDTEEYDGYHPVQGFPTPYTITRWKNDEMVLAVVDLGFSAGGSSTAVRF